MTTHVLLAADTQSSDIDGARKLEMLLQETPNPQPAVAQIWAEKLGNGMTVEDVLTYMMLHPRLDRSAVEVAPPQAVSPSVILSVLASLLNGGVARQRRATHSS